MCFGSCRVTCDNCKPKFVYCAECGTKNLLFFSTCYQCKAPLTQEMKDAAVADWEQKKEKERQETLGSEQALDGRK